MTSFEHGSPFKMMNNQGWCPLELIDYICSFIDQPADLLPISLASKAFWDIVAPNHLQYRRIRCDFRNATFWKALVENKSLISQVRYLEIVAIESDLSMDSGIIKTLPAIPKLRSKKTPGAMVQITNDNDIQEALRSMADAIRCMPLLKRFTWTTTLRPDTEAFSALFQALSEESSHLHEVEIRNWGSGFLVGSMTDSHLGESKLWDISNLTRFSYAEHYAEYDFTVHGAYIRRLSDMLLQHCPGLEDLQLFFPGTHIGRSSRALLLDMFAKARWTKLKRLTVDGSLLSIGFFKNHQSIEALCIRQGFIPNLDLTSLHSLQNLEVVWSPYAKELSPTALNSLQHLDIPLNLMDTFYGGYLALTAAVNLQSLVIRSTPSSPLTTFKNLLGQLAPSLKRLALIFDWDEYDRKVRIVDLDRATKRALTEILSSLPALTHFSPAYLNVWAASDDEKASELKEEPEDDSESTDSKDEEDGTSDDEDSWSTSSEKDIPSDRIEVAIESLISLAPKLTYVGVKMDDFDSQGYSPLWMIVERDEEGKYDGFFTAKSPRYRRDVDPNLWGEIYYGAGESLIHLGENSY